MQTTHESENEQKDNQENSMMLKSTRMNQIS